MWWLVAVITFCQVAGPAACYERLGRLVRPLSYRLHLKPHFSENFTYQGELSLEMSMNETNELWLDCDRSLELDSARMTFDDVWPVAHNLSRIGDRLRILTAVPMRSNYRVQLYVNFTAPIRRDLLSGFYLSKYRSNGTTRYMGSTQFESYGARQTFPCFDEPRFRSRFQLEITVDPAWRAISNTPLQSETILTSGERHLVFEEMASTPVYLVGWAVFEESGFGRLGSATHQAPASCSGDVTYSVWADLGLNGTQDLALSSAPLIVGQLENFTGVICKAVTKKMDLVAIPDFSAGAMENWGMITFRESALLLDTHSTILDELQVRMIVAHELVHQWFGNLVTPDWWSFVWLSEGMARYLQYFISHEIWPGLQLDEQFLLDRRQAALEEDGSSARPLTSEDIQTTEEFPNMFDVITYDKGASVIHMFRAVLGDTKFKEGINTYLTRVDSGGGVTTPDWFFSSFPDLPSGMRQWTETAGYPVLLVDETEASISIRQVKITDWNRTEESDWLVPISISINGNISWHYLQPNGTLEIPLQNSTTDYFINVNQTGYYRVLYRNPVRWLSREADRSALVDDAMALAYAGLLPYSTAVAVAVSHLLEASDDYSAWAAGLRALDKLAPLLEDTNLETNFTETVVTTLFLIVETNLDPTSSPISKLHKMNILKHACNYGQQYCLDAAKNLTAVLNSSQPEIRAALLCTAVRQGDYSTWEEIWDTYLRTNSPSYSQLLLKSLTCTSDRQLIRRFLSLLMTENIRKHDITPLVSLLCSRRLGAEETYSFFKNNYDEIYNYFGETRSLRKILSSVSKFFDETHLNELKNLSSEKPELNLDSFIKSLEKTISWRGKVYQQLRAFITNEPVPDNDPDNSSNTLYTGYNLTLIISLLCVFVHVTY